MLKFRSVAASSTADTEFSQFVGYFERLGAAFSPDFAALRLRGVFPFESRVRLWCASTGAHPATHFPSCFGIALSLFGRPVSRRALYLLLANSSVLELAEPRSGLPDAQAASPKELVFDVFDGRGGRVGIFAVLPGNGHCDAPHLLSHSTFLESETLCAADIKVLLPGCSLEGSQKFPLPMAVELSVRGIVIRHQGRLEPLPLGYGARLEIQGEGVGMEQDRTNAFGQENLCMTLDLGAVEMALSDFLRLRVGSVIELEQQFPQRGLLRYGGTPIALVDIQIQSKDVTLRIHEFLQIPGCCPRQTAALEETLAPDSR